MHDTDLGETLVLNASSRSTEAFMCSTSGCPSLIGRGILLNWQPQAYLGQLEGRLAATAALNSYLRGTACSFCLLGPMVQLPKRVNAVAVLSSNTWQESIQR